MYRIGLSVGGWVLLSLIVGGCLSTQVVPVEPGIYEGRSQGYGGPIRVSVQTTGKTRNSLRILDIVILDHQEDPLVGGAALETLREEVLAANGTDLDGVSGATESSRGFLAAIDDALDQAILH
ncbi:MAG: FMN-binding protein [Treponema sp.]|nr:FMN-binding protein [Treponema sp.]